MPNIRAELAKKNPCWISKHAFYTAYHYALQYDEWKREYELLDGAPPGMSFGAVPNPREKSDQTAAIADRRQALRAKMETVEAAAILAGGELYPWLLLAVTKPGISYNALRQKSGIPCGKNEFYQKRRYFYYLLDQKIN